jgi:hypothetical protein
VQYFDGVATFEEISFRTGMSRKEIERVLSLYPDDVSGLMVHETVITDIHSL